MRKAVVLLSGGLDSATVLALARRDGFSCYALSFQYGQRHAEELKAAAVVASVIGVEAHRTVNVDMTWIGGSALTAAIDVPKNRSISEMSSSIPITYVPARNTIFLSFALAWAEVLGAVDIFAGMNALDYSGYPDCRPEFIAAYQQMARLGTKVGVDGAPITVHTPLIAMTKKQIIQTGLDLGVDYGLTLSCYAPKAGQQCQQCDACLLRAQGFAEAQVQDPARAA